MQQTDLIPVRFSRLKLFGKSAAHYEANVGNDTASLRKGSATHSYLLGDSDSVVVYEDGARNPRHKKYQEFLEANEGKLILSPGEFEDVSGMRASIQRNQRAMELLDGVREQRIEWMLSGRCCAGTPDVVHLRKDGTKVVVELKTSVSAAPDLFRWQAKKMGYHAQLAWYAQGLETTLVYAPGPVVEQYIVVVESSAPYPVTVIRVTDKLREKGLRQCRVWFEQLLVCEQSGHFPGYVEADVDWDDEDGDGLEWDDEEAA
jgi:hypothetical protein